MSCGKVFPPLFSKSDRRSNARSVGRLRRGEISFSAFSFAKLFFCACCVKRKAEIDLDFLYVERKIPVYLSYPKARFFLWQSKRKEKSLAKKKARAEDFASAEATNAPRVGSAVAFGKATQNLSIGFALNPPINQNLKTKGKKQ